MNYSKKVSSCLIAILMGGSLFAVYWATMAPGLTWANYGSDGGDLITAAATRGVAHPTSYPTYLVIARLFQALPFGNLAFRTNIMSAVFGVGAALLIYWIVSAQLVENRASKLAGLIAGLSFGLTPIVWSQAVITEVYTLHAFFVALVLFLGTIVTRKRSVIVTRLLGFSLGLAIGNHITSVFLLPILFFARDGEENSSAQIKILGCEIHILAFFRAVIWLFGGMLIYLLIPLRARAAPPINWMNPVTWQNFWQLVTGKLYQPYYLQPSFAILIRQLQALAGLFVKQFGWLGLLVGIFSGVIFFRFSRLYLATMWIFFVFSSFALIYTTVDSYLYIIPALLSFSIWIGLGFSKAFCFIRPKFHHLINVGAFLFLGMLFLFTLKNYAEVDASNDHRAENFGMTVLQEIPDDAILFAQGDEAIFSLWYFHFALERRSDIAVIALELLPYEWYQENIRTQYPDFHFFESFLQEDLIISANPHRPICYVRYDNEAKISCSAAQ